MRDFLLVLRGAATGLWLLLALPTFAQVQELTHAHATIDIDGKTLATEVRLPYHWDRRNQGRSETAEFVSPACSSRDSACSSSLRHTSRNPAGSGASR